MKTFGRTTSLFFTLIKLGIRKVPDQALPAKTSYDEDPDPLDKKVIFFLMLGIILTCALGTAAGFQPYAIKLVFHTIFITSQDDIPTSLMWPIWLDLLLFAGFMGVMWLGRVCGNYILGKACCFMRRNATKKLQQMYMDKDAIPYFVLNTLDPSIDNADARMSDDVDAAFASYLEFFSGAMSCLQPGLLFSLPAYTVLALTLWFHLGFTDDHESRPEFWMITLVTGLPVIMMVCSFFVSMAICKTQRHQHMLEANLRRVHARIRLNAEAIAFYGGEHEAVAMLRQKLDEVAINMTRYAFYKVGLDVIVTILLRFSYVLGWVVAEAIAPNSDAENMCYIVLVVEALLRTSASNCNQIIDLALATSASVRVVELYVELERQLVKNRTKGSAELDEEGEIEESHAIILQNVRMFSPQGELLPLPRLTFKLAAGQSLLVVGPPGCGKSTLLRLLSGLWPFYRPPQSRYMQGSSNRIMIARPISTSIFCLTQRPYLHSGTLREQIAYPVWDAGLIEDLTDTIMEKLLMECNLGPLTTTRRGDWDKLGINWGDVLSLGEQQRLAFCRLFWHRDWQVTQGRISADGKSLPGFFALLDSPTSAMDIISLHQVYHAAKKRNIAYLTISHTPSLVRLHDKILSLTDTPYDTRDSGRSSRELPRHSFLVRGDSYSRLRRQKTKMFTAREWLAKKAEFEQLQVIRSASSGMGPGESPSARAPPLKKSTGLPRYMRRMDTQMVMNPPSMAEGATFLPPTLRSTHDQPRASADDAYSPTSPGTWMKRMEQSPTLRPSDIISSSGRGRKQSPPPPPCFGFGRISLDVPGKRSGKGSSCSSSRAASPDFGSSLDRSRRGRQSRRSDASVLSHLSLRAIDRKNSAPSVFSDCSRSTKIRRKSVTKAFPFISPPQTNFVPVSRETSKGRISVAGTSTIRQSLQQGAKKEKSRYAGLRRGLEKRCSLPLDKRFFFGSDIAHAMMEERQMLDEPEENVDNRVSEEQPRPHYVASGSVILRSPRNSTTTPLDFFDESRRQESRLETPSTEQGRHLVHSVCKHMRNDDLGYSDSDDDENILARRVHDLVQPKKLVPSPYQRTRDAEPKERLGWHAIKRIFRVVRLSVPTFFWLLIPVILSLISAVGLYHTELLKLKQIHFVLDKSTSQSTKDEVITQMIGWCCSMIVMDVTTNAFAFLIMVKCRSKLTNHMHRVYMNTCAKLYYVLNYTDKRVDNIDQRMTVDVDLCLRNLFEYMYGGIFKSGIYPGFLHSVAYLLVRSVLCLRVLAWGYVNEDPKTGDIDVELVRSKLPKYNDIPFYQIMVDWGNTIAIATCLVFLIPAVLAARHFTNVQERQQEYEADLKHQHQLVCSESEAIALSAGSGTESSLLSRRLKFAFRNSLLFLKRRVYLDIAQSLAFPYGPAILSIIPAAICAISIAKQNRDSTTEEDKVDVIIQADLVRRFFVDMCEVVGFLICSLNVFAQSSAFAKRVMKALELQEEFLMCEAKLDPDGIELLQQTGMDGTLCCGLELARSRPHVFGFQDVVRPTPSGSIRLVNADIYTPVGDRLLLHDVNLELHAGDTTLLVGPSGTGKSSLVRVLGRIWPLFKAKEPRHTIFTRPDTKNMFFIAQQPFMCMGSLRQQVAYPCWEDGVLSELTDDVLRSLLEEVDLLTLYKRIKNNSARPVFRRCNTPAFDTPESGIFRDAVMESVHDATGQTMGHRPIRALGSGGSFGCISEANYVLPLHADHHRVGPFDDPTIQWDTVLSVGEQQRLQFARLLWHFDWLRRHRPCFAQRSPRPQPPQHDWYSPMPSHNRSATQPSFGSHTSPHPHWNNNLSYNHTIPETEPLIRGLGAPGLNSVEPQGFFAILDEATAALDVRAEVCCYSALQKRGIGFLSVSNRPSLLPFHKTVIHLDPSTEHHGAHRPKMMSASSNNAAKLLATPRNAPVDGRATVGDGPPCPLPESEDDLFLPRSITSRSKDTDSVRSIRLPRFEPDLPTSNYQSMDTEGLEDLPFPRQEFAEAHLNPSYNWRRTIGSSCSLDHDGPPRRYSFG